MADIFWPAGSSGGSGSNASVGPNGSTAPTSSTEVGFIDGSGNLQGVSATNPLPTVIEGPTPLPTGAATSANQVTQENTLTAIQANQTNGNQVTTISGTVPLPTGAATSALQIAGNTSLSDIDTKTPALGAAVTASSTPVNIASDQIVPIVSSDTSASGSITTQNLNPSNGAATAGSTVSINLNGQNTVGIQVTGTYTGNLVPQVTIDGVNWVSTFNTINVSTGTQGGSLGPNAVGGFHQDVSGMKMFRMSQNSATTGTAVVSLNASISTPLPVQQTVFAGTGTANIGNVNLAPVTEVTDVASAAIITTTTSATITPAAGSIYAVNIDVTAATGTTPTMSVAVQESYDGGTNWVTVYTFPLITTTGSYNSAPIPMMGRVIRYVQTIGGSTPSFTRSIIRNQSNEGNSAYYRNFIDTAIAPITTNSTTSSVFVEGLNTYTAIVNQGTGGSSVVFAMDGSDDNVNWVQNLTQVAGVVGGATPVTMAYANAAYRYIRARVVTGVAATTISYVSLVGSMGAGSGIVRPASVTFVDKSGTTSGTPSTSTLLSAANPIRKYFTCQNLSSSANISLNFTSAANATSSFLLLPFGTFTMEGTSCSSEAINVFSTTASVVYAAKEA